MPIRVMTVVGAVLAHGRDHEAVLERHVFDLEWLVQRRGRDRVKRRACWRCLLRCIERGARRTLVLYRGHDFAVGVFATGREVLGYARLKMRLGLGDKIPSEVYYVKFELSSR